jgi:hypothetical protein
VLSEGLGKSKILESFKCLNHFVGGGGLLEEAYIYVRVAWEARH